MVAVPRTVLLAVVSLHLLLPAARSSRVFSVADYGAAGDGCRYDTAAIQAAVDACAAAGGGRVLLPAPGDYLTATVHLRSLVVLEVAPGARLLGGIRQQDYPRESDRWYVVLAENTTGAGVTGGGEINGQGGAFVVTPNDKKNVMVSWNATGDCEGDECRPRLVGFIDSKDVKIHDITLNQPAYWCLHLVRCDNSLIHNVSIFGDWNTPNNDGIDITDSNNTVITDCHIDTGDDAICPKSTDGPVYNLTATNCWIRTKSCAIKFGSASYFNFGRLVFDNITIVDSHRGLGMQIRDGGNVSDVVFSNIKMSTRYYHPSWWGRAEPIYITTCPRHPDSKEGTISNIQFINITSVSENGVFLAGSKHGLLRGLKFKNVDLTYKRWTNYTGGLYDYRPGCEEMVKHRTGGMMLEHISGLEVDNDSVAERLFSDLSKTSRKTESGENRAKVLVLWTGSGPFSSGTPFRPAQFASLSLPNPSRPLSTAHSTPHPNRRPLSDLRAHQTGFDAGDLVGCRWDAAGAAARGSAHPRRRRRGRALDDAGARGAAQGVPLQPAAAAAGGVAQVGGLGAALLPHFLPHHRHPRRRAQRQA